MIEVLDIISPGESETGLTDSQIEFRRGFIGSSSSAKLVGMSRYGGTYSLYQEMVNGSVWESTSVQRAGTAHERGILSFYAAETGHSLLKPASIRVGHLVDSVDAIVVPEGVTKIPNDFRPDIVVEAKMVDYSRRGRWGRPGTDQIDPTNLVQVIHHIGCWGAKRCDVVAMVGGRHSIYHVEANPDMFQLICDQADAFMKEHYLPRIPPPPDTVEESIEINRSVPHDDPDLVDADRDLTAELARYSDLLAQRDAIRSQILEAEDAIQKGIGEKSGAAINGRKMCSFKWEERSTVDRKAIIDHLLSLLGDKGLELDKSDVLEEFTTSKGSRVFRPLKSLRGLTQTHDKEK